MAVFAVIYRYTADHGRRAEVRPIHRQFLEELGEANLCTGPFGPEEDAGALLLIRAESKDEAVSLTDADPFRVHGLVTDVSARQWLPAIGSLAAQLADS